MTVLDDTPNNLDRIDAVWAFISSDETGEGVCACYLPGMGMTAMIAADERRLQSLMPIAEELARFSGKVIKLIKLTTREEVRVIEPPGT